MTENLEKTRTESLELSYEQFKQILLCPVCQEMSLSPIYQCPNGHLVCSECIDEIPDEKCPCCRIALPEIKIRALAVEQLTQNVQVDCKHRTKGCPAQVKMVEYAKHLSQCAYQALKYCRLLKANCDEMVEATEFRDHVEAMHGHTCFHREGTRGLIFQEINRADLNDLDVTWEPIFMLEREKVFVILSKYDVTDQTFSWRCVAGPLKEPISQGQEQPDVQLQLKQPDVPYQVYMIIEKESSVTSETIKLQWAGPVTSFQSLQKQNESQKDPSTYSFYVPLKVLRVFAAEDPEILKWTLKIAISEGNCSEIDPLTLFQNDLANGSEIPSVPSVYYHTNEDVTKAVYHNAKCDICEVDQIKGIRYKCVECVNYDLCASCKRLGNHNHHVFFSISNLSMTERMLEYFRKINPNRINFTM